MVHELKCGYFFFEAVLDGRKMFEVRKDDRGFMVGDEVHLREWGEIGCVGDVGYTGREVQLMISYYLDHEHFPEGLQPGYVVLGLKSL